MRAASEVQRIGDVLFWETWEPSVKTIVSSCAVVDGDGRLVIIDPIPLEPMALEELAAMGEPKAIFLTNGNHAREAGAFRGRFSAPILSGAGAVEPLGLSVDATVADGQTVASGLLRAIELPGAGPGEMALVAAGRSLHLGDALINLEPDGLGILPAKYCDDHRVLQKSLRKLLPFEFGILTFAHGLPIASRARQRLHQLLA